MTLTHRTTATKPKQGATRWERGLTQQGTHSYRDYTTHCTIIKQATIGVGLYAYLEDNRCHLPWQWKDQFSWVGTCHIFHQKAWYREGITNSRIITGTVNTVITYTTVV